MDRMWGRGEKRLVFTRSRFAILYLPMITTNKKDLVFAKQLAKYTSQWVALKNQRIVAFGKSLRDVKEQVENKKIDGYVFHFVEKYPIAM
jgi:hypothetical protein